MRDRTQSMPVAHAEACDGCRRDYPPSLLTAVGKGVLRVCPKCLPEALATVRTEPCKAAATA
ncbi:MAG TPA: hypothetical protein VFA04_02335 [Bryobacteraceae bacterium]|nr:hypothetical protein [Bryobacteraceae bacterium]